MHRLCSLLLGGVVVAALTPGCRSDEITPSPVPPAYARLAQEGGIKQASKAPRGRRKGERVLDGVIASVGDQFLTRREVERRLRLTKADPVGDTNRELEVDRERVRWAEQQLLVKAARQAGITVPPDRLDEYAENMLQEMMKIASEELDRPMTRDQYLAERRITWEEFTSQMRDEFMSRIYLAKLRDGLSGARPVIDRTPSPSEVRRIYRENLKEFDIQAGAKLALFQLFVNGVADDDHTPAEWEALVKRRADQLASLYQQGHKAKKLARHYGLDDEEMGFATVTPMTALTKLAKTVKKEEFEAWLLDPNRRVRDTIIINDVPGPLVVGIEELRAARVLPYSEAREKIVNAVRAGMADHLKARTIIEMIARGAVVSPPELEDLLLDVEQDVLDRIAADPLLKSARLQ